MSWTPPSADRLYAVIDTTWPAASMQEIGPFTLRRGAGGGQRVSAASLREDHFTPQDIETVEQAMDAITQPRLFMLRDQDQALGSALADRGYFIKDPVTLFAAPSAKLAALDPKGLVAIDAPEPLAVMVEIWQKGGIGAGRLHVMRRAPAPKACFLGRIMDQPAGAMYVGCDHDIAMLHALEVTPNMRRLGLGRQMMGAAGAWGLRNGAATFSLAVLTSNTAACGLYRSLGMVEVGRYHYRKQEVS
ncbi:MAG: GNAT family N-acetyltransferase [Paracoccaceae bacterium]